MARNVDASGAASDLPEVNFSDYGDIRFLHLGTEWVQGSMLIDAPFDIQLEYVQLENKSQGCVKNFRSYILQLFLFI